MVTKHDGGAFSRLTVMYTVMTANPMKANM